MALKMWHEDRRRCVVLLAVVCLAVLGLAAFFTTGDYGYRQQCTLCALTRSMEGYAVLGIRFTAAQIETNTNPLHEFLVGLGGPCQDHEWTSYQHWSQRGTRTRLCCGPKPFTILEMTRYNDLVRSLAKHDPQMALKVARALPRLPKKDSRTDKAQLALDEAVDRMNEAGFSWARWCEKYHTCFGVQAERME
ncbi:MAG: disulfide bond formation protein B [Planctomycetes bacterium]|nr:disulfide bond formation protein B [Planctomycetota bacterium]MBM4085196.1 disulfide bond formation protein B [Planctomycetota bacterium]